MRLLVSPSLERVLIGRSILSFILQKPSDAPVSFDNLTIRINNGFKAGCKTSSFIYQHYNTPSARHHTPYATLSHADTDRT